jgi:hypothetical protein
LCISMKSKVVNIKNLNQPLIQGDFDWELLEWTHQWLAY